MDKLGSDLFALNMSENSDINVRAMTISFICYMAKENRSYGSSSSVSRTANREDSAW